MNHPLTNIVVTCLNALEYTKATLDSLFTTTHSSYYLTIIDNGSRDETKIFLESLDVPIYCKGLKLIINEDNMGPGYAANQGFAISNQLNTIFTCLCNNDLYFQKDWLEKLEKSALNNLNSAMIGPLRPATSVMYDDITSTIDHIKGLAGYCTWRQELEMYTGLHQDKFDQFSERIVQVNGGGLSVITCPPDALSSCCVLLRNSIFYNEFGYLADPIFTHYGSEDIDMSWAIAERGYGCAVSKDVYVHHFRGKSLRDNNLDRASLIMSSNRLFFNKWRSTIRDFIEKEAAFGVDIDYHLTSDRGDKYWFLQRLNRDIQFWSDGSINKEKFDS